MRATLMQASSKFTATGTNDMARPNIQIDDEVREMTEEEYQALLDGGWTPGDAPTPDPDSDPA